MKSLSSLRVAIIADWLTTPGGAEKVIEHFVHLFPNTEIFTSVCIPEKFPFLKEKKIHTTYLQKLPALFKKKHQFLFPFLPSAIETLDLKGFDIVLSSSSFVAKSVLTDPETPHICFCHTPTRYLWDEWQEFIQNQLNIPSVLRPLKRFLPAILSQMRPWDIFSAQRPDIYIGNSEFIVKRIQKYYGRDALLVRPPVDYDTFSRGIEEEKEDYFVAMGRLIPYKKFDLLVKTFLQCPEKKLKIGGRGVELQYLKRLAGNAPNIEFLGFVPDSFLPKLLGRARAFLFPQMEDAGIAPMEALAAGTPVIAYKKGGSLGLIEERKNGVFFEEQTEESLLHALNTFEQHEKQLDRKNIQESVEKFSGEKFEKNIQKIVMDVIQQKI